MAMSTVRTHSGYAQLMIAGVWWVLVGAAVSVGIVGLLTIGVVFVLLGLLMGGAGIAMRWTRNRAAFMAITGAAAGPLVLAWINWGGSGPVCQTSADVTGCVDRWSPWPFLAVAAVLVIVGLALATRKWPHA